MMATMASLADATPPIALGALDGRYRGTVAPLVDHLSEAALNRRLTEAADSDVASLSELVHFACTSEDINNLSYALMVKGAVTEVWLPRATALVDEVATMARDLRELPLLAHTHGQPATPTTMGKELAVLA